VCVKLLPAFMSEFRDDLDKLLNRASMENGSNTPDFILAEFLHDSLRAFDSAVNAREKWYNRPPQLIGRSPAPAGVVFTDEQPDEPLKLRIAGVEINLPFESKMSDGVKVKIENYRAPFRSMKDVVFENLWDIYRPPMFLALFPDGKRRWLHSWTVTCDGDFWFNYEP
jgi:hypothetical protein